MLSGSSAASRTRPLARRTSCSTRSVAWTAWQSPSRWRARVDRLLHRLDAREADPARARRAVVRDVDVERVAVADVDDLALPHLAPRAGHADDARAALRLRGGGQGARGRSRAAEGSRRRTTKREPSRSSEVAAPSTAGAPPHGCACTSRSARTRRRGMRRRRLRCQPGRALHDAPVAGHGEHQVLRPAGAQDAALGAEAGDDDHRADLPHPGGSGAPAAPVAAVTRPVAVSTARTPVGAVDEPRRDLGRRAVLLLAGALLEQQLHRAAVERRSVASARRPTGAGRRRA